MNVVALQVAPVKGLGMVARDEIEIGEHAVEGDRCFFLLGDDGEVVTLRRHPELAAVLPAWDGERLALALPGGDVVGAAVEPGERVEQMLFGRTRTGRVVEGPFAPALSEVAGAPIRLVRADPGVGWDEGPVTVASRASIESMGEPDRRRFRLTIELDGVDEPFGEDALVGGQLEVGTARLRLVAPLERCVVITRSPESGVRDWDGLRELAQRRGRNRVCLGLIAEVTQPGRVTVGDRAVSCP
jgi:uncharacterized protein YcbX